MNKSRYVQICPNCSSRNIGSDLSTGMIAWGGSTLLRCNDCGNSAPFFPEVLESELKNVKIEKKMKRDPILVKGPTSRKFYSGYGFALLVLGVLIAIFSFDFFLGEKVSAKNLAVYISGFLFPILLGSLLVYRRLKKR